MKNAWSRLNVVCVLAAVSARAVPWPADCGACRGCTAGHTNSGRRRKCIRRSCQKLKEIKAESRCRRSSGEPKKKVKSHLQTTKRTVTQRPEPAYVTSEDKDGAPCKVPTRKIQSHQQAEKILKRAKINPVPKEPEVEEEKPVVKPCPPLSEEPAPESPDNSHCSDGRHARPDKRQPEPPEQPELWRVRGVPPSGRLWHLRLLQGQGQVRRRQHVAAEVPLETVPLLRLRADWQGGGASRPRTSSPERGQEAAMPSPVKPVRDSSGKEDNPHSSPEQRSPPSGEALNLKKLLMVMVGIPFSATQVHAIPSPSPAPSSPSPSPHLPSLPSPSLTLPSSLSL
ncbi:uncharacterized protein, partial [Mobula birostris]|uniref:uncharacterized protein n=1 Tax=Mobula birostris TaxID=1983395 RepID=UPI003B28BA1E